jgi:hypothetical protein
MGPERNSQNSNKFSKLKKANYKKQILQTKKTQILKTQNEFSKLSALVGQNIYYTYRYRGIYM